MNNFEILFVGVVICGIFYGWWAGRETRGLSLVNNKRVNEWVRKSEGSRTRNSTATYSDKSIINLAKLPAFPFARIPPAKHIVSCGSSIEVTCPSSRWSELVPVPLSFYRRIACIPPAGHVVSRSFFDASDMSIQP